MRRRLFLIVFIFSLLFTSCKNSAEVNHKSPSPVYKSNITYTDLVDDASDIANKNVDSNPTFHISLEDYDALTSSNVDIHVSKLKNDGSSNNPIKIKLSYNSDHFEIISNWNDGIRVSDVDFDKLDSYQNIYITELGTDIKCITHIYKYDQSSLIECFSFSHLTSKFIYDEKGHIYYYSIDSDFSHPDQYYDCNTMETYKIEDEETITQIMEY